MIRFFAIRLTLALLLPVTLAATACAGDKARQKQTDNGLDVTGQITLARHKVTMVKGVPHQIEVLGKDFTPRIVIVGAFVQSPLNFKNANELKTTFTPMETKEYTIVIMPEVTFGVPASDKPLAYSLKVKPIRLAAKPMLRLAGKFTEQDMKLALNDRNSYYKSYPIKLKAGGTYLIDLEHAKNDFNLDPYLYLKDGNQIVARDDDSGGNLNARILYTAPKDGEYTIIATTLRAGMTGDFTLTVRGPTEGKAKKQEE